MFSGVCFQLFLPGFGPRAVVPLRYSNRLMAEKHGYSFDGYACEKKFCGERIPTHGPGEERSETPGESEG